MSDEQSTEETPIEQSPEPTAEVRPEVPSNAVEVVDAPSPIVVDVNTDAEPAQVTGPAQDPIETVQVNETSVQVDRVITDTSDPNAVIVPPEGRGDALTPLGRTFADGGKTPEDFFSSKS